MTKEVQNPELYKHLKAATKETSGLLKMLVCKLQAVESTRTDELNELNSKDDLTQIEYERLEHLVSLDPMRAEKAKFGSVVERAIKNTTTFKSCVVYFSENFGIEGFNDEEIKDKMREKIGEDASMAFIQQLVSIQLLGQIIEYLGCSLDWEMPSDLICFRGFNEQTFDVDYAEYEQFLYSNLPVKYQIVASLVNFDYILPSHDIVLSGNTRIVSNKEHNMLVWNTDDLTKGDYTIDSRAKDYPPNFWLEIDYEIEKGKVPSGCKEQIEHVSLEKVQNIIKILRLYKKGDFKYGIICWRPRMLCNPPYNKKFDLSYSDIYDTPNNYLVQKDDVKDLQLLFQKYINNLTNKYFPHSAVYYLDKGIKETDMNDRLVNYTAALESLFVLDGKEGIATLLANRTAFFLDKDGQKRKEISKDIKKAYGFRSNIVHGNYHKNYDKKKGDLALEDYCNKTEGYVRMAIVKWIDMIGNGMKRQDIYDMIEENWFT
jgi:hypothetical protein